MSGGVGSYGICDPAGDIPSMSILVPRAKGAIFFHFWYN